MISPYIQGLFFFGVSFSFIVSALCSLQSVCCPAALFLQFVHKQASIGKLPGPSVVARQHNYIEGRGSVHLPFPLNAPLPQEHVALGVWVYGVLKVGTAVIHKSQRTERKNTATDNGKSLAGSLAW